MVCKYMYQKYLQIFLTELVAEFLVNLLFEDLELILVLITEFLVNILFEDLNLLVIPAEEFLVNMLFEDLELWVVAAEGFLVNLLPKDLKLLVVLVEEVPVNLLFVDLESLLVPAKEFLQNLLFEDLELCSPFPFFDALLLLFLNICSHVLEQKLAWSLLIFNSFNVISFLLQCEEYLHFILDDIFELSLLLLFIKKKKIV